MSGSDCFIDASGCMVCPATDGAPATPTRVITSANLGWNAGANSILKLDGDVHMVEAITAVPVDTYLGFKYARANQTQPYRLAYAFRIYKLGTQASYELWEGTAQRVGANPYVLGTPLEIVRASGQVTYFVNGSLVYSSAVPSKGPLLVNACLFSAGDTLP